MTKWFNPYDYVQLPRVCFMILFNIITISDRIEILYMALTINWAGQPNCFSFLANIGI